MKAFFKTTVLGLAAGWGLGLQAKSLALKTVTGVAKMDLAVETMGCGIRNIDYSGVKFCAAEQPRALWRLVFRAGPNGEKRSVDSTMAFARVVNLANGMRLRWDRMDLDPGDKSLDVVCEVVANDRDGRFEFRIRLNNRNERFGLCSTEYPRLSPPVKPDKGWVAYPGGNWGARRVRNLGWRIRDLYPGFGMPMQLAMFDSDHGAGLLVSALDYEARLKYFSLDRDFSFMYETLAEEAGVPGADGTPPFAFAIYPYKGDWWQGAKIYRRWALGAPWMAKGPISKRKDFHQRMRDAGLWLCLYSDDDRDLPDGGKVGVKFVEEMVEKALERIGGRVPLSVHWYCWQPFRHDEMYPVYLPPRKGFEAAAKRIMAKGVQIMPYINARIVDANSEFFTQNAALGIMDPDGKVHRETYGRESCHHPICQTSIAWREYMADVVDGVGNGMGIGAVYIDQVASMRPCPCFDRAHGHPLGGGRWWVDGYRMLTERCRARAPQVALTSENSAEPYIDLYDNFLTWCPNYEDDVPAMAAVYSGYQSYFACSAGEDYDLKTFRAVVGRAFLFGCQVGWQYQWILDDRHRKHFEYLVKLCEIHRNNLKFFCDGELMGEEKNEIDVPVLKLTWQEWDHSIKANIPSVMAFRWRDPDGRGIVAIANYDDQSHEFRSRRVKRVKLAAGEVKVMKCAKQD